MRIENKWLRRAITFVFAACALMSIYPLFWMLLNSFKDTNEIMTGNSFGLPKVWKFANYTDALIERGILKYFWNSIFVTACTLILTLTLAIMLSYGLTRMKWRLSVSVKTVVTIGILLPSQIVIIPIFMMLRNLGLINSPFSLILTISAFNLPMATLMISSFMKDIPFEMEEAAVMDGASLSLILKKIIIPIIKPAIATASINIFMNSWNEFIYALVLITGDENRTLPVALINYSSGKYGTDYGGMFAAMVITSILPILLFVLFSKEVERTISAGAILK